MRPWFLWPDSIIDIESAQRTIDEYVAGQHFNMWWLIWSGGQAIGGIMMVLRHDGYAVGLPFWRVSRLRGLGVGRKAVL